MRETADREDRTEKHIMMPGRVIPVREMLGELLLELDQPPRHWPRSSSPSKRIPIASATCTAPHARPSSQAIVKGPDVLHATAAAGRPASAERREVQRARDFVKD